MLIQLLMYIRILLWCLARMIKNLNKNHILNIYSSSMWAAPPPQTLYLGSTTDGTPFKNPGYDPEIDHLKNLNAVLKNSWTQVST